MQKLCLSQNIKIGGDWKSCLVERRQMLKPVLSCSDLLSYCLCDLVAHRLFLFIFVKIR